MVAPQLAVREIRAGDARPEMGGAVFVIGYPACVGLSRVEALSREVRGDRAGQKCGHTNHTVADKTKTIATMVPSLRVSGPSSFESHGSGQNKKGADEAGAFCC